MKVLGVGGRISAHFVSVFPLLSLHNILCRRPVAIDHACWCARGEASKRPDMQIDNVYQTLAAYACSDKNTGWKYAGF